MFLSLTVKTLGDSKSPPIVCQRAGGADDSSVVGKMLRWFYQPLSVNVRGFLTCHFFYFMKLRVFLIDVFMTLSLKKLLLCHFSVWDQKNLFLLNKPKMETAT